MKPITAVSFNIEGIIAKIYISLVSEGILSAIKKNVTLQNGDATKAGEFDDLISALRTGDVFGEDVAKFKRSRKNRMHSGSSPPRRNSVNREDSRERVVINVTTGRIQ